MKVALTCDHLLEREPVHSLLEMACSMFPEAMIFTLAHQKGKVLGPIELHSIRSSYLSNKVKNLKELESASMLIPSAAKKLQIPCSFDLVIHFSTGLAHGISTCENTSVITYLYEDRFDQKTSTFLGKVFHSYLKSWSHKFLEKTPHLLRSINDKNLNSELLRPFFKFEDFSLQKNESQESLVVVHPGDLCQKEVLNILKHLEQQGLKVVIISNQELSYIGKDIEVLVSPCSGKLLPLFSSSLALVDGSQKRIPLFSLQALASGRPILALNGEYNDQVLSSKTGFLYRNIDDLTQGLLEVSNISFSPESLRSSAARYSQIRFKSGLMRKLKDIGHPVQFS